MKLRSPVCDAASIEEVLKEEVQLRTLDETLPMEGRVRSRVYLAARRFRSVLYEHALGLPLDAVRDSHMSALHDVRAWAQFIDEQGAEKGYPSYRLWPMAYSGEFRSAMFSVTIGACLEPDPSALAALLPLLDPKGRGRILDLLVPRFLPAHAWPKGALKDKIDKPWADRLLPALARAPAAVPAALKAYLDRWPALMKPLGLVNPSKSSTGRPFADMAFEVALAVCAYDIDDTGFRDHPFYPRDLADHYRRHIRLARDAWRPQGEGLPIVLPVQPRVRTDLDKSKLKGVARWMELAVGGDKQSLADVLEAVGKPRRLGDPGLATAALSEVGYAVNADIKDDATVELQLRALFESWGLGEQAALSEPPAGPARCTALLVAARNAAVASGHALVEIHGNDEAWHAVLVPSQRLDEWLALGDALGVRARSGAQAFAS